ncbi:hypothetical protein MMC13_005935 [Lambiella insularis]|nr:hypothetical protein [Lambiella insularis]
MFQQLDSQPLVQNPRSPLISRHFRFMELPHEVRTMVYKYLFPENVIHSFHYPWSDEMDRASDPEHYAENNARAPLESIPCTHNERSYGFFACEHDPAAFIEVTILQTCRQIYNEAIKIVYGNPVMSIPFNLSPMPFILHIRPKLAHHVNHLSFRLNGNGAAMGPKLKLELPQFDDWLRQRKQSDSPLKSLCLRCYIHTKTEEEVKAVHLDGEIWDWTFDLVSRNQVTSEVKNIYLEVIFLEEPPPFDFMNTEMISRIESWHDLRLMFRYNAHEEGVWRADVVEEDTSGAHADGWLRDCCKNRLLVREKRRSACGTTTTLTLMKDMDESEVELTESESESESES